MQKKFFVALLFSITTLAFVQAQTTTPTTTTSTIPADIEKLLKKHACNTCHKVDTRLIGPAFVDVAAKKYSKNKIVELIYKPEPANWPGYVAMAAQPDVPKADAKKIAAWIAGLKK
jgi:cytochrome c